VTAFPSGESGTSNICADVDAFRSVINATGDVISIDKSPDCDGGMLYRIEFLSGDELLNLSSFSHGNLAADEAVIIRSTIPLTATTFKKPGLSNNMGSNGGPTITGNGTNEVRIDNVSSAFGGNRNVWEVNSNGRFVPFFELEYYRSSGSTTASFEAFTINHSSNCDHDCDGIANIFDTDSDDDDCLDAIEAGHGDSDNDGVLGSGSADVDANGLVLNQGGYTGSNSFVTDPDFSICNPCSVDNSDNDMDGICDLLDLDDDNDGITDENENNCDGINQPIPAEAINNSRSYQQFH